MDIAIDEFIRDDDDDYIYDEADLPIMPTKPTWCTFAQAKEILKGIPERRIIGSWGIKCMDGVFKGIKPATVALFGASSGVGKTTLSLYFMRQFYKQNLKPFYLSTEMQLEDIRDKCAFIFDECPEAGFQFVSGIPSVASLTNTIKDIAAGGFDVILLDYINSGALSSEGYEKVLPDQLICMLLESVRSALGKMFQETGKAPMIVVFTQLNRSALGNSFPDARALQGSMSAANKCDYAVNFVKDKSKLDQSGYLAGWVYKNRWGDSNKAVLFKLDYQTIEVSQDAEPLLGYDYEDDLKVHFYKPRMKA